MKKLIGGHQHQSKDSTELEELGTLVIQLRENYDPGAPMTKIASSSCTDEELLTLNELNIRIGAKINDITQKIQNKNYKTSMDPQMVKELLKSCHSLYLFEYKTTSSYIFNLATTQFLDLLKTEPILKTLQDKRIPKDYDVRKLVECLQDLNKNREEFEASTDIEAINPFEKEDSPSLQLKAAVIIEALKEHRKEYERIIYDSEDPKEYKQSNKNP